MIDSRLPMIRGANVVLALAVILGCTTVMAYNLNNWHVLLSGLVTMSLWGTLGYATWQGLGPHSTPLRIRNAQFVNIAILIVFALMILVIGFLPGRTSFANLLPMLLLTIPLLINIQALEQMKAQLDPKNADALLKPEESRTAPTTTTDAFIHQNSSFPHYCVRHWRGAFSLPMAFWINGGLLAGMGTVGISSLIRFINHSGYSLRVLSFLNLGALLLMGMILIWAGVGVWRSAEQYVTYGGSANWRNTAQGTIVFAILTLIGPFANSFLPQLMECALIASGHDPLGNIQIAVSGDKKSVIVNGMLREGASAKIQRILDETPGATTLMLNSRGGRVLEAKQLVQTVQTRKLNTYVEGQCSSACTYVFLAGKDRAATPNAQIGFHQPTFPGIDSPTQKSITQDMLKVYRTARLPEEFINILSKVEPHDMWYPTRDELIESHVITRVSLGGEAATYATTIRSKQELRLTLQSIPLFQAVEKRFPGTAGKAVDLGWVVTEQGGTDADMINAVRRVFINVYPKLLKTADGDTLDGFVTLLINEMSAARSLSGDACAKLMVGKLDITKTLPQDIVEQEEDFLWKALANPTPAKRSSPDPVQVAMAFQTAFTILPPQYIPVVANMKAYSSQPDLVCEATIAFYRAIAELPKQQRHVALQGVFQGQS